MFGWLQRKKPVIVVEEYQIEVVDLEGFRKLHIRFRDGFGKMYRFEMHPAHTHFFSDELLRKTALAMAPK